MYPYRVFISYSHGDLHLVERLDQVLSDAGVIPMWDKYLLAGTGFSEQIQNFISNSHALLAFITATSAERPWLHTEIGFATALGKSVLPVTLGASPLGIIRGIQAVRLQEDLADAPAKLSADFFRRLFEDMPERPAIYECAADNARRAMLLARYADSVWAIQKYGTVRQKLSLSSFQFPDRGETDPVWKKYFPATPDDGHVFEALHHERVALHRHTREGGCRLILDPAERLQEVYRKHGPACVRARVNGLLAFLRDESIRDIVVAINDDMSRISSVTLVGDWFSSEAVSTGGTRVLIEALFTRDARKVRQQIKDFDNQMHDLLAMRGWDKKSARREAVSYYESYLAGLPRA